MFGAFLILSFFQKHGFYFTRIHILILNKELLEFIDDHYSSRNIRKAAIRSRKMKGLKESDQSRGVIPLKHVLAVYFRHVVGMTTGKTRIKETAD